jgi:uncharacterized protein with von Willebrand factor type A (vWA) domain
VRRRQRSARRGVRVRHAADRLTRALTPATRSSRSSAPPQAAPDWSSGTRIGDALREFNDRHGRRGMARGAVDRDPLDAGSAATRARRARDGAPRAARHRIVWVNPRVGATAFSVQPAAWWPRCRTATRSSAATASRRSARSPRRSGARPWDRRSRAAPGTEERAVGQRDAGAGQLGRRCPAGTARAGATRPGMGDR